MDVQALISGHTEFMLQFAQKVFEDASQRNAVFSPMTVAVALSMAAAGAKGPTLHQIMHTCFNLKSDKAVPDHMHEFASQLSSTVFSDASSLGGPILSFVNGIWVEKSMQLKPAYVTAVNKYYSTEAQIADFVNEPNEVRTTANKWASEQTKGRVQELLPDGSIDKNTRMILANALYFLGTWKKQFDSSVTKDDKFHQLNGETIQVPMMTTRKKQFIKRVNDCKILRLPYLSGQDKRSFSMYFLLPDKLDGLPDLEKTINMNFIQNHLSQGQEVDVKSFQLPKFKLSFSLEASEILKQLGLVAPFTDEADFTEVVDSPTGSNLFISNVFHKAFVEVNEKGTEAAAASAATIQLRSLQFTVTEEDFVADHPFMFVIKEDVTGVVLFIGHVLNPLSDGS
eukprot:TRINITY_DN9163_c0_g1_i1.p1 TRINITY_DN9163_c0_g1~~TRINITY_DN9163_c0_g1_i1.p1  ORF type:complete len:397 (-),score=75.74 TRINITY_DN9163_c0_g1_i1:214-1404(-)